jgi:hypothetical protein
LGWPAVIIYLGLSLWAWIFAARTAPTAKRKPGCCFARQVYRHLIVVLVALPVLERSSGSVNNFINTV